MVTLPSTSGNPVAPMRVNGFANSGYLDLIRLTPLLERTRGSPEVKIGLIDGPVTLDHPDLATVPGEFAGACTLSSSAACRGISGAKKRSLKVAAAAFKQRGYFRFFMETRAVVRALFQGLCYRPRIGDKFLNSDAAGPKTNHSASNFRIAVFFILSATNPFLTPFALAMVTANVNVDATSIVRPIPNGFSGLSYEKTMMATTLFDANNVALVTLFQRFPQGIVRLGGNSMDRNSIWNPTGPGLTPGFISPADVDRLAAFLRAAGWRVLYGLNLGTGTAVQAEDEARYATQSLGDRLEAFEIGNEPDMYAGALRPTNYNFWDYHGEWNNFRQAILAGSPSAVFAGADIAGSMAWGDAFANDDIGLASIYTRHYYRGNGQSPSSTMSLLLSPDPNLWGILNDMDFATSKLYPSGGTFRVDECNSFYDGGAPGVSNAFGAALWAMDFIFENAGWNRSVGVNFHGGGDGPGYTPIANNPSGLVDGVRPLYYGMYLFSLAVGNNGNLVKNTLTTSQSINFSSYSIARTDGSVAVILNNKDPSNAVTATINFGSAVLQGQSLLLTASSLTATSSYTMGGVPIGTDGSWHPTWVPLSKSGSSATLTVPSGSAILVVAAITPPASTATVDDSNTSAITYTGSWMHKADAAAIDGTMSYALDPSGDAAQLAFTGTGVEVFAKTWSNKGMVNVYIDAVFKATVDEYSSQVAYKKMIYSDQTLSLGNHTIKIVEAGIKNPASSATGMDLDAFAVTK
jgi:hypothetical protein